MRVPGVAPVGGETPIQGAVAPTVHDTGEPGAGISSVNGNGAAVVAELEPDYVVNSLTYLENLIRPGTAFEEHYEPLAYVGRAWRRPIAVYRRLESGRTER